MLIRTLALAVLVISPVTVLAQTAPAPAESPAADSDTDLAPLPPLADAPASDTAQSNSALDQPITNIADTPSGCAVLDRDFPGLRAHPMYPFFKTMTLNQIAALSHGQITQEMLMRAQTDLAAQNIKVVTTAPVPVAAATPVATAAPRALVH
jgi:hypothetical protein